MDIDSGNLSTVAQVKSEEQGRNIEVDLEKTSFDEGKAHSQTNAHGVEEAEDNDHSKLPFSVTRSMFFVLSLTGAAFLNTLGVQAAVIILPSIGRALNVPSSRQQWIISAYSLTFGCFLLLFGRIADVYGKRLVFLAGSAWFTIVTIVCPFMPNEIAFDVFRGLQGLASAATMSSALGILGATFKPGKYKNYAFAIYGAGAPLGSVFGNIIAGLIGEWASWKWIFWVIAILAAMVTVAGYFLIPPPSVKPLPENKPTVDWVGGATITIALLVLLFALTEGNVVGWSTPWIPVLIVAAILMIGVFVLWQWYLEHKTTKSPLMKVSVFKSLRFSGAMLIMMFFFASFSSYLVFTTFFFQDYQGLSVIQTMLRFIPTGVVGLCTAFTTGFMLSRVRGDHLLFFGTLCVATSSLLFAVPIPPETTYWAWAFFAMILSVFGADTLYPTLTLFTAQSLPPEDQALGGALVNALAQVGRAIGLAISTAIQTAVTANREGVDVKEVGNSKEGSMKGNAAYLDGLRAANYTDFAYAVVAFLVVAVAFRGAGKVGSRK